MAIFTRDDEHRAKPAAYRAVRALTASAARIDLGDATEIAKMRQRVASDMWQYDCWEYFDAIGEIKYGARLVGAILSRVRLYPAYNVDPDQAPVNMNDAEQLKDAPIPNGMADAGARILNRLDTANGGQSGMLNRAGVNLWVAGECYLVQEPEKIAKGLPETWDIKSVDELVVSAAGLALKKTRASGSQPEPLPEGAFAGRIWNSHARYSEEADSSVRAVRDLCDELLLLNKSARATVRSRLNAGAMYLPDGLSLAADADEEVDSIDGDPAELVQETDSFEEELIQAMTTPIEDESDASAVVPLIIRGPAELADKIKILKFERSFDPELVARSERVLERILQGLDIPKDVVTGLANVKYSNAIHIDESLYKAHIEPLVLLICDALTEVYFRPALKAMGFDPREIRKAVIWYDPSEILTRPDRAQSANDGYDRKNLSAEAWRRAHGYSEADAPTPQESLFREALTRGPMSPEISEALFKVFAPELLNAVRQQNLEASPSPFSDRANDILNGGQGVTPEQVAPSDKPSPNATPAPAAGPASPAPPPTQPGPAPAPVGDPV